MKVSQYFTSTGIWGAVFFVLGNVAGWIGWWSVREAMLLGASLEAAPLLAVLATGAGSLTVLISVPMMLVGRAYDVTITHIPKDKVY